MKQTRGTNQLYGKGYQRFHQQLLALKQNDLYTVKKLAKEARHHLSQVQPKTAQMMLMAV